MKLRILSTAILIAIGLTTPVRADLQQSRQQTTIQTSGDDYDWEWQRDRQADDVDQEVRIEVDRGDRDWSRRDRDRSRGDRDWSRRDRRDDFYDAIDRIYQEVLGRSADNKDVRKYSKRLEDGDSLPDIRSQIANSSEARERVANIFEDITGRNASRNTIKDYTRKLASGWTLSEVEDDIIDSK